MRSTPSAAAAPIPRCYDILADDWDVEARCRAALDHWGLPHVGLTDPVDALSGGERTETLSGGGFRSITPLSFCSTNRPITSTRRAAAGLYDLIRASRATIVVVSHDVALLNLLGTTCELSAKGLKVYGGNYDFFTANANGSRRRRWPSRSIPNRRPCGWPAKKAQEGPRATGAADASGRAAQGPASAHPAPDDEGQRRTDQGAARRETCGLIDGSRERLDELRRRQQTQCELKIDFDDAQLHDGKLLVGPTA